jgi:hypothetical protein
MTTFKSQTDIHKCDGYTDDKNRQEKLNTFNLSVPETTALFIASRRLRIYT